MLASYKVCLHFIVLSVTVCTVGYVCLFCGDQIFMYLVSFLSVISYEVISLGTLGHTYLILCCAG